MKMRTLQMYDPEKYDYLRNISTTTLILILKKYVNLVYEVALDVQFGHKLANCEFWITKLPHRSVR
jgi:hypothetical protein